MMDFEEKHNVIKAKHSPGAFRTYCGIHLRIVADPEMYVISKDWFENSRRCFEASLIRAGYRYNVDK